MLQSLATGALFGAKSGSATPSVLALHGWGRSHRDFDLALNDGVPLNAFSIDLPGFGATPVPEVSWGSADYAEKVAAVLKEMTTPVVLVGHSFGGRVALHLAANHPTSIHALVLTGVPLLRRSDARRPALSYRLIRKAHQMGVLSTQRLEKARQRYGSPDYRATEGVLREIFVRVIAETYTSQIEKIACPVHLLWGATDAEVPVSVAERALALFKDATLRVVPLVGHLLPSQAPHELRKEIEAASL